MTPASSPPSATLVLADIGGTNTRVALAHDGRVARDTIRRYANASSAGLPAILKEYLNALGAPSCTGACIAVAGPVQDGVAEMTNLSWRITSADVADATGARIVAILNDLQAQGHALDRLAGDSLRTVIPPPPAPRSGARLVIGVGTGFNAAPVHRIEGGLFVAAAESGHATLPLRTEEDLRLAEHVEKAHGFAGVEDVLSGRGLERLYSFHAAGKEISAAEIMKRIGQRSDAAADATCRHFVTLLGRVASDLALDHLPFGGIYLVGGVARAFAPYLSDHGFTDTFRDKGRFSDFMGEFAVHVVEDDYAALEGCADHIGRRIAD
jgi:glucokinase